MGDFLVKINDLTIYIKKRKGTLRGGLIEFIKSRGKFFNIMRGNYVFRE